jgi:hypothetical protein
LPVSDANTSLCNHARWFRHRALRETLREMNVRERVRGGDFQMRARERVFFGF